MLRSCDPRRRHSPTRPSSSSFASQLCGTLGEVAAEAWLVRAGLDVRAGFESDAVFDTDLDVNGHRLEVMTARVDHRLVTGFCVPPSKAWAAGRRGAWGYLFPGVSGTLSEPVVWIDAACPLPSIVQHPPRLTRVAAATLWRTM